MMGNILTRGLRLFVRCALLTILIVTSSSVLSAQGTINEMFIAGSDASAAPSIDIYVYAIDGQGNSVDLTGQNFTVNHGGNEIDNVPVAGKNTGGTFTIFILDIPEGVSSLIPTVQDAITQFATDSYMMQETDYVAIYRVGELGATELLKPESFHNSVINVFASPPSVSTGSTALIDSVMDILSNLEAIKPKEGMPVNIVLFSDGTDTISEQNEAEDVPRRAAELGVPIHTIWLDNQSLPGERKEIGQQYMSRIAAGTRGEAVDLSTADVLSLLWEKISAYRDQYIVRYSVDGVPSGDQRVSVALANNPAISDETTVTIAPGAPRMTLDIPEDSRQMTLENVDQPIQLSFSTIISWPDDSERTFSEAYLKINGIIAQEIDVDQLENFDASVGSLIYGENRFQIEAIDDQGHRVASPEVVISVLQGTTEIPEAVAPSSAMDRILDRLLNYGRYVGGCLLVLLIIVILVVAIRFIGRSRLPGGFRLPGFFRRVPFLRRYVYELDRVRYAGHRVSRAQREVSRYAPDVRSVDQRRKEKGHPAAFLEVLESASQMPKRIDLDAVEIHLGRSAKQAEIAFARDGTVSRIHATIVQEGSSYRIFDEQSTSGTFVNEQHVPQPGLQLADGDIIRIGAVRLRFRQP